VRTRKPRKGVRGVEERHALAFTSKSCYRLKMETLTDRQTDLLAWCFRQHT